MKRKLVAVLTVLTVLANFRSCSEIQSPSESAKESASVINSVVLSETEPAMYSADEYYAPDYNTQNSKNSDLFLDILKRDGYYRNGELDRNYNTDNINSIVNITPPSITDETSFLEVFLVKDGYHCFLMTNQKIYRYETVGGFHLQLCLWDYDGNGIKDLVSYQSFGSGMSYLGVSVLDLSTMESHDLITRNFFAESVFSFECKNGTIYIDGEEVSYRDGQFHCNSFPNGISE